MYFANRRDAVSLRFPALSWLPVLIPAQELRRSLLPNRPICGSLSASYIAALSWLMPGMVCIKRHSSWYGAMAATICLSISCSCSSNQRI